MLAIFGKGAAKVDLVLYDAKVPLGGFVRGEIVLLGGEVEQEINKIKVELYFELKTEQGVLTHLIAVIPYQASFFIQPKQRRVVPFELPIPEDLLVSSSTASYYLKTHLDIQGAIDAIDRDEITVTPSFDLMQALLALQQLGFVEETTSRLFNGETQEFIFTPTTWLADKVQRVSFIVALDPDKVRLLFDLEIHSMFGRKTKQEEVSIPLTIIEDIGAVKGYLQQRLQAAVDGKSKNNNEARRSVFEGTMGMFVNNLLRDFQRKK